MLKRHFQATDLVPLHLCLAVPQAQFPQRKWLDDASQVTPRRCRSLRSKGEGAKTWVRERIGQATKAVGVGIERLIGFEFGSWGIRISKILERVGLEGCFVSLECDEC